LKRKNSKQGNRKNDMGNEKRVKSGWKKLMRKGVLAMPMRILRESLRGRENLVAPILPETVDGRAKPQETSLKMYCKQNKAQRGRKDETYKSLNDQRRKKRTRGGKEKAGPQEWQGG